MESSFSRLAPFIREFIYEKKWKLLRDIQEAAIREVLDGSSHILIAAGTASGKTEAAFFPVISVLSQNRPQSVGALYIGPLKALINDQAERLSPLMGPADLPLWRWHGDVSDNHKKKLLEHPSGILQITPESLEALLLRSPRRVQSLFRDLSFVIIDEVHAFIGSDRGDQILCQLARIEEAALCRPRRIGLSATLGDYREAQAWLAWGSSSDTVLIREGKKGRTVSIALDCYSGSAEEEGAYYAALYRQVRGRRSIIFTNSRLEAENTIASLGSLSQKNRGGDRFYIHHGSIPASLRGETEKELREGEGPVTAAATATLELGIDIGTLDRVIQIGAPLSVSAFVQRLGRSGRRRGKAEIYFTSLENSGQAEQQPGAPASLPWNLLKTIAVIELYLKEKWIEQGLPNRLPYNLLVHQTLSILAGLGEHSPASLTQRVLSLPAFSGIAAADFDELLDHLIKIDIIEKTAEGGLICGLAGERLTVHYSFYSVFADDTEYRVFAGGREIGRVNFIPPAGSSIVLGGRFWRVDRIRQNEREIAVSAGEPGSIKIWRGSGVELHPVVARRMRTILCENEIYPYLSLRARVRLEQARSLARQWKITGRLFIPAVEDEKAQEKKTYGFTVIPWTGSRGMRTLLLILQDRTYRKPLGLVSLSRPNDYSFYLVSTLPVSQFREALKTIISNSTYPQILPDSEQIPLSGKFDALLPPRLLVKQYAANMLDLRELTSLDLQ
ncbi:MAG: DEAD/DEAH box helicase [Treponema sp.]|jgi:ATP-dependent Lhr-like helicase|nr:DEAD/DEAH box helicase [Treponema sp.]